MSSPKILRSCGTHDGTFHADEVTACALLLQFDLIDEDKIIRTRNLDELATCDYVCDVGGIYDPSKHLFDHHQVEYQGSLSSAGMILQYLNKIGLLSDKDKDFLNHSLIIGVDAHDNGKELHHKGVCTYSHIISNFIPIDHDADANELNAAFFEALNFARKHLKRLLDRHAYTKSCRKIVAEVMKTEEACLIFEKSIPWLDIFFEMGGKKHPAKFVIMPSGKHWKLRGIPPSAEERMKVRIPLPQEWAGLLEEELKKISGISGAIFCHKGKFISVWETKEDALQALEYTLNANKEEENEHGK